MKRVILVGSPRTSGRSAHLAEMLFEANIEEHPEDELFLVPISEIDVGPCIACNACRETTPVTFRNDGGQETTELRYRCVFDDDMQTVYDLIDEADEVTVVSPVFFSGAPAQLKCLLDRLQPYFWKRAAERESGRKPQPDRATPHQGKRPATLHVIGEGGDPHGYDALVSEVKSSLAMADFRLERVLDWVGKITEEGEIVAEATEKVAGGDWEDDRSFDGGSNDSQQADVAIDTASNPQKSTVRDVHVGDKPRPKLDLGSAHHRSDLKQAESRSVDSRQTTPRSSGAGKSASRPKGSKQTQRRQASSKQRKQGQRGKRNG